MSLRVTVSASLLVAALHVGTVRGDPAPTADVTGAPVPGNESGQTYNEESSQPPSGGRQVARGILLIPKGIAWAVLLPVRGLVWTYDRYDLDNRYFSTFYNWDRSFGVSPTIAYATGFSIMGGGKLISTDTFGGNERLLMAAAYGGSFQARGEAWLDSGKRLGPVLVTGGGNFDRFARLPFYGIGNADRSPQPAMLIDPLATDTAVKSHYRYQEARAVLQGDVRVLDSLHVIAHGAITDLRFDPSTRDPPINDVYNPMDLVGFDLGVTHLYGQVELRWDRRRVARPRWETTPFTTGWLASGFIGGVHGFQEADDFGHYGVDLQAFVHLAVGPRMLWLRFLGQGVTGNLDEVPFTELPYLGGDVLRGYDFARFRDRLSGVATAQYIWDLQRSVDAFLFVDAGRVYRSFDDVTLDDLRAGFGGGLSFHSAKAFLLAASLATSVDGGAFFTVTLNPLWNEVPRWR